jgi:hypothetical protein
MQTSLQHHINVCGSANWPANQYAAISEKTSKPYADKKADTKCYANCTAKLPFNLLVSPSVLNGLKIT